MYKNRNKSKKLIEYSFPLYQSYITTVIQNMNVKVDHRTGSKLFSPRPQTPQGESVAELETVKRSFNIVKISLYGAEKLD